MDRNDELEILREKILKLEKTNSVLMKRVEQTIAQQGSSFSFFEKNIHLQDQINRKTALLDDARTEMEKLRKAIDEAVLVSETDINGIITHANDRFCEVSGFTREELIGQPHSIVNAGKYPDHFWKKFWETIKNKGTFRGEICNRRKNGELYWVESTMFPILDKFDRIKGFASVRIDITDKKQQQEKIGHNEKLAAIGSLAAGVGHEINNPLAVCVGNLTLIKKALIKHSVSDESIVSKLDTLDRSLGRIRKIVDGLRTFARSDGDDFEDVCMGEAVENTISLVKEIYTIEGIDLVVKNPNIQFVVKANTGKMQQILMNLISNAKDATEGRQNRSIKVELNYQKSSKSVLLSVTDNGTGIPQEIRKKILEPFFTTKKGNKGTGIGLGLVSEFVSSFNGELSIDSTVDVGTTFHISFPLAKEIEEITYESPIHDSTNFEPPPLNGLVLVVDDEPDVRDLLCDILVDFGFTVDSAADGFDAIEKIKQKQYDFICTDINMPKMQGDEFIKKAQNEENCKAKFFVISGGADGENKLKMALDNQNLISGYIKKPFTERVLYAKLAEKAG